MRRCRSSSEQGHRRGGAESRARQRTKRLAFFASLRLCESHFFREVDFRNHADRPKRLRSQRRRDAKGRENNRSPCFDSTWRETNGPAVSRFHRFQRHSSVPQRQRRGLNSSLGQRPRNKGSSTPALKARFNFCQVLSRAFSAWKASFFTWGGCPRLELKPRLWRSKQTSSSLPY